MSYGDVVSVWMKLFSAEPKGILFLEMVRTEQMAKRAMLAYKLCPT